MVSRIIIIIKIIEADMARCCKKKRFAMTKNIYVNRCNAKNTAQLRVHEAGGTGSLTVIKRKVIITTDSKNSKVTYMR